ncbi:MAG: T9SS type A sorting domain-containing protein, partial [Bacteroidota bacterium]
HTQDSIWSFSLRNYFPPFPSLQDPSRDAECIYVLSQREMLVGWNGMLVNVNEPTAGMVLALIDTAHWWREVWSGGGFPTSFNIVSEHPPAARLYADLYGLRASTDSGRSWNQHPTAPGFRMLSFSALDRSNRYLYTVSTGGAGATGLISLDLTANRIDTLYRTTPGVQVNDLVVLGDTLVLAAGSSTAGVLLRSTNRGTTWSNVLDAAIDRLDTSASSVVMFAGGRGIVHKSTNSGSTWTIYNNSLPQSTVSQIVQDTNSDTLYIATRGAGVIKLFAPFTVDVPLSDPVEPASFRLEQNYPNPFNPRTTISFSILHSSFITLRVFDVLGREVATLVNEEMKPGSYQRVFDGSGLASGVYLYRLHTANSVQTKKLLLIR